MELWTTNGTKLVGPFARERGGWCRKDREGGSCRSPPSLGAVGQREESSNNSTRRVERSTGWGGRQWRSFVSGRLAEWVVMGGEDREGVIGIRGVKIEKISGGCGG